MLKVMTKEEFINFYALTKGHIQIEIDKNTYNNMCIGSIICTHIVDDKVFKSKILEKKCYPRDYYCTDSKIKKYYMVMKILAEVEIVEIKDEDAY